MSQKIKVRALVTSFFSGTKLGEVYNAEVLRGDPSIPKNCLVQVLSKKGDILAKHWLRTSKRPWYEVVEDYSSVLEEKLYDPTVHDTFWNAIQEAKARSDK